MFRKDIENVYTDTVREYLDNGYRIYYSTMGGSQGEIAKVDLTILIRRLKNEKDFQNQMFGR